MAETKASDFKLPTPQTQTPTQPQLQPAQPAPHPLPLPTASLTSQNAVIGIAIVLVCALAFFFVRGGLRSHLIARRASPSAAGSAGWSLFAFLLALTVTIVFGLLGDVWQALPFLLPMSALILVTLIVFAMLYSAASRGRR